MRKSVITFQFISTVAALIPFVDFSTAAEHHQLTEEEEQIIYDGQKQFGNRWAEIAKLLPGRYVETHWRGWVGAVAWGWGMGAGGHSHVCVYGRQGLNPCPFFCIVSWPAAGGVAFSTGGPPTTVFVLLDQAVGHGALGFVGCFFA